MSQANGRQEPVGEGLVGKTRNSLSCTLLCRGKAPGCEMDMAQDHRRPPRIVGKVSLHLQASGGGLVEPSQSNEIVDS